MLDTPRMDILAACCVPVFVKSLEELFYLFGRKAKLPDKKYVTVSSKRAKYSCQHEWVGLWSLVSTDYRHTHTQTHTQPRGSKVATNPYLYFIERTYVYIYIHISYIIFIYIYANAIIFANIHIYYVCLCGAETFRTWGTFCTNFVQGVMTVVSCFSFLYSQRSIEPMLPRIGRLCTRLLHAIFLLMQ